MNRKSCLCLTWLSPQGLPPGLLGHLCYHILGTPVELHSSWPDTHVCADPGSSTSPSCPTTDWRVGVVGTIVLGWAVCSALFAPLSCGAKAYLAFSHGCMGAVCRSRHCCLLLGLLAASHSHLIMWQRMGRGLESLSQCSRKDVSSCQGPAPC